MYFRANVTTPPDSGIRENNVLISFRMTGHAVPTPFLVLRIRVVMIVAAQSLQLGMVFVKLSPISISITQFPFTAFLHEFSCCSACDECCCVFAVSVGAKFRRCHVSFFLNEFLEINMKVQMNPSAFVKMND